MKPPVWMSRSGPKPVPTNTRSVLVLKGDPLKDLSPNVNPAGSMRNPVGSMRKKARLVKEWKMRMFLAWQEGGSPTYSEPVRISFVVRRGRKLDPDNALAGLKPIIDGLTARATGTAGLVPDDTGDWISYAPVDFNTGDVWKGHLAHVVLIVEPMSTIN